MKMKKSLVFELGNCGEIRPWYSTTLAFFWYWRFYFGFDLYFFLLFWLMLRLLLLIILLTFNHIKGLLIEELELLMTLRRAKLGRLLNGWVWTLKKLNRVSLLLQLSAKLCSGQQGLLSTSYCTVAIFIVVW